MHILFAISILCFFALVLMATAIVRHRLTRPTSTQPQQDFAQHLFEAAEDQDSRTPRTLPQQTVRDILVVKSWDQPSKRVAIGPDTPTHQPTSAMRF
jgi:hypothetical protein